MDPSGRSPKPIILHRESRLKPLLHFCIATLHICGSLSGSGLPAAVLQMLLLLQMCLTASLALTWIHSWQKCGFDTTRATLLISTFVALMFCQSPSLPPSPIYVATPRLRERELQLQSDLTTASREINRLRQSIIIMIFITPTQGYMSSRLNKPLTLLPRNSFLRSALKPFSLPI